MTSRPDQQAAAVEGVTAAPTDDPTAASLARLDGLRAELEVLREDVADPVVRELLRAARRNLDGAVRRLEDVGPPPRLPFLPEEDLP